MVGKPMKKYLVSAVMLLAMNSAYAADMVAPDDAPVINASETAVAEPVAERWGGFYVGAALGQGYLKDSAPATGHGWVQGAFVGYNKQWGNFVAGVEGTIDNADITFTDGSGIKSKVLYAARVRAGFANDWMFAYGSIGAQHGTTNLPKPFAKDTALQLGAGVDFAVTKNITLGADFTYAKYKKFADFTFFGNTVDVETKKLQARVSYSFN
jgi:outer membrane immunogenic protein